MGKDRMKEGESMTTQQIILFVINTLIPGYILPVLLVLLAHKLDVNSKKYNETNRIDILEYENNISYIDSTIIDRALENISRYQISPDIYTNARKCVSRALS